MTGLESEPRNFFGAATAKPGSAAGGDDVRTVRDVWSRIYLVREIGVEQQPGERRTLDEMVEQRQQKEKRRVRYDWRVEALDMESVVPAFDVARENAAESEAFEKPRQVVFAAARLDKLANAGRPEMRD